MGEVSMCTLQKGERDGGRGEEGERVGRVRG